MSLAHVTADAARLGIRLEADGDRLRYFPAAAMTPELAGLMKGCKAELLAMLRATADVAPAPQVAESVQAEIPARPVCRCGSTSWRDEPIHGGRSMRRDCRRCGRFVKFPVWYGKVTGQ